MLPKYQHACLSCCSIHKMLCYIINLTAYDRNLDLIFFPAVFSSLPLFLENKNLLKILGEVGSYEGVLK